jgi:PAS domain S-box-containing protein
VEAWRESRWYTILGFVILSGASVCVFFLVYYIFHRDLNRRRVAELALADSKNWLELVLEADTGVSIIATDAAGLVTVFNTGASRMLGYTPSEVIGKTTLATFHLDSEIEAWGREARDDRGGSFAAFEERIRLDGRDEREWTYVRKDGSHLTVNMAVTPVRDGEGRTVGLLSVARDVTESRRMARELSQKNDELEGKNRQVLEASRLKSEFLANMSHELRTPLNGIIGFSELIQDGKAGPVSEAQKDFIGDILTSSRHLLHLINEVLDLAKVEAGKTEFRPEPVVISKLTGEVRDILRPLAAGKGIHIEIAVDAGVDNAVLDPSKLKQVLYNYLSNALKFTPDGGAVSVRVFPEDAVSFRLEVRDTGIGIPAKDMSRLFGEFQQIDQGPGKQHEGTGLGLALTKRLVEAQGGRVGVTSEFGAGSTFYAVLPRVAWAEVEPPGQLEARMQKALGEIVSRRKPALLVIEDSAADRTFLVNTLSGAGYSVETAASGAEAIAKCAQTAYDAITLDLLLADTNGWEVLREIRRSGPNVATPVIVVTVVAEKAISVGFQVQDFLTKPVQSSDLLASLSRAGAGANADRTILVVDDDPAALKLMETALGILEYRPLCCASAVEGLAAAAASNPAAVILDLLMPGMSGIEFLRHFRRTGAGRRTPVIVWTNRDLSSQERLEIENLAEGLAFKKHGGTANVLEELRACLEAGGVERAGGLR